jgi:hypothetical protein
MSDSRITLLTAVLWCLAIYLLLWLADLWRELGYSLEYLFS